MGVVVHVVDSSISSDVMHFNSLATVEDSHVVIGFGYMCNGVAQMVSDIRPDVRKAQFHKSLYTVMVHQGSWVYRWEKMGVGWRNMLVYLYPH